MTEARPTWLTEPCPPWCVRDHAESDHAEDRYHQSEGSWVAALMEDATPGPAVARTTDLVVRLVRRLGEATTWVRVEEAEGALSLRLSAGSALRLADAIASQPLSDRR